MYKIKRKSSDIKHKTSFFYLRKNHYLKKAWKIHGLGHKTGTNG